MGSNAHLVSQAEGETGEQDSQCGLHGDLRLRLANAGSVAPTKGYVALHLHQPISQHHHRMGVTFYRDVWLFCVTLATRCRYLDECGCMYTQAGKM